MAGPQLSLVMSPVPAAADPANAMGQQRNASNSADAVSEAVSETPLLEDGADAAGSAAASAMMEAGRVTEPTATDQECLLDQPSGSERYAEPGHREATDEQPAATGDRNVAHAAVHHAQTAVHSTPREDGALQRKIMETVDAEASAQADVDETAAAAVGGIRDASGGSLDASVALEAAEMQTEENHEQAASAGDVALDRLGADGDSEGILDGTGGTEHSPGSNHGAVQLVEGLFDSAVATAEARSPNGGDGYGEAVLDGMVALNDDAAGNGYDVFGDIGGNGGGGHDADFGDGDLADWEASADDAVQFGAHHPFQLLTLPCKI